jgi:hypothetical protein
MTALEELKEEFELTDEQLRALPPIDSDIELELQNDSHMIPKLSPGKRPAHPYRLYVDDHKGEGRYVYLFRKRSGKPMVLEIAGKKGKDEWYEQWKVMHYQTVSDLAFPYNETANEQEFIALVKFYFVLGLKLGRYDVDPGFSGKETWYKDLRAACDSLIKYDRDLNTGKADKGKQELSQPQPLSKVAGTPAGISRSPAPSPQSQSPLASSSEPHRDSSSTSRSRLRPKRSKGREPLAREPHETMDHLDDFELPREQRRTRGNDQPSQFPTSGLGM